MMLRWPASTGLLLATALVGVGFGPSPALAAGLDELMSALSKVREVRSNFREEKELAGLTAPLLSSGTLAYSAPNHLEKRTSQPFQEQITVDGDWLTYAKAADDIHYTMTLSKAPELRGLVEAVRGTLAGDLGGLQRYYTVSFTGTVNAWQLTLVPVDSRVERVLKSVTIDGRATELRQIETVEPDGDLSRMSIEPAAR